MESVTSVEDVNLLTRCSSEEEARLVGVALIQMLVTSSSSGADPVKKGYRELV